MHSGHIRPHWSTGSGIGPVFLAAFFMFALGSTAPKANTADDPAAFLQNFGDRTIAMLSDGELSAEQRRGELHRFFRLGFDMDAISRFVLGRHWRAATESERSEFKQLFEDFIVSFYASRFDAYAGETLKVGAVRVMDQKTTAVSSRVVRPAGSPIRVDWRLRRIDQSWRIVDVVVEGVSLAIVQRSEFDSLIRSNGGRIESLLAALRKKVR